jgi:tripartite tricarboxylate transporter family receptor
MNRTMWLQERRMAKFADVLKRWEHKELSAQEAGEILGCSERQFRRWRRLQALPNIPPVADSLPGYEVMSWFGIGAPRGTSPEIVGTLNKEINAALAEPGMMARFAELGGIAFPGSPADFANLIADETDKWTKVIRAANIKLE